MISRLSSSGAVKIATLDGEEIPNWISGCRIKKYTKPLTTEHLNWLHKAKWRTKKTKLVAEMAQEEACQRAQKCKFSHVLPIPEKISKRYKITFLNHLYSYL